jgi:hypothetical protein
MLVLLFDPAFGARWDRRQWIARRLLWADPHEIAALQMRRDTNTSLLRNKASRDGRWIQDKARLLNRFHGVEKWKISQATKRSHIKLKRIDKVLTMLDMLLKYLGSTTRIGAKEGSISETLPSPANVPWGSEIDKNVIGGYR